VGWLQRLFAAPQEHEEAFSPLHERVAVLESSLKALERDILDLATRYRRLRATQGAEARVYPQPPDENAPESSHARPGGSAKDALRRQYLKPHPRPGSNGGEE
jgi:hypothetical protein